MVALPLPTVFKRGLMKDLWMTVTLYPLKTTHSQKHLHGVYSFLGNQWAWWLGRDATCRRWEQHDAMETERGEIDALKRKGWSNCFKQPTLKDRLLTCRDPQKTTFLDGNSIFYFLQNRPHPLISFSSLITCDITLAKLIFHSQFCWLIFFSVFFNFGVFYHT